MEMELEPQQDLPVREGQSELSLIANAIVRIYKDHFGRGPTKAKATYADDDTLICSLRESLTPAEKSMVRMGEHQRLRDLRMFLQYASESEFRATVEEITGRQVESFVSGVDTVNDVACEVFYLVPVAGKPTARTPLAAITRGDRDSNDRRARSEYAVAKPAGPPREIQDSG